MLLEIQKFKFQIRKNDIVLEEILYDKIWFLLMKLSLRKEMLSIIYLTELLSHTIIQIGETLGGVMELAMEWPRTKRRWPSYFRRIIALLSDHYVDNINTNK